MDTSTLTGNQNFILQVLTLVLGALGTIVTAVLAYMTIRIKNKQETNMNETRENMGQLAKAVNGKVSETVAQVRAASMLEGAKLEADRVKSPEDYERATTRIQQVVTEAGEASKTATLIAHSAAEKIFEIPSPKK